MADCPIHGPRCEPPSDDPDDVFAEMVSALVSLYLLGKDVPRDENGRALVTAHAERDDEHGIFMLKIGLGRTAHTVMTLERDAAQAARDGGTQ